MDEHYGCLPGFRIQFLDIDARSVNIEKATMLGDKLIWGYLRLSATERY